MPQTWLLQMPLLLLAFARCAGAICLAPPLSWRHFPLSLRLSVAAVLSLPLLLVLPPDLPATGAGWLPQAGFLVLLVREVAVGAVLGLSLWLLMFAAGAGGRLAESGLFEEQDEEAEGPLATLLVLLFLLFFLQLNGLPWLLNALRDSYRLLPLSSSAPTVSVLREGLYWPAALFANMLLVGAPLLVATVLASWLVAAVQRLLPGLGAAQFAPAVRHLAVLMTLVVIAPLLGGLVLSQLTAAAQNASAALLHLGGH